MPREGPRTIVKRLLEHIESAGPWSSNDFPEVEAKDWPEREASLRRHFRLWAESWMIPDLKVLLKKFDRKKKGSSHEI